MADGAKKRKVGELLGGTYEESEEEDEQSQEDLAAQFIVETISSAYILGSTLLIETANEPADKAAFVTACADSVKAALVAYGIPFEEVSSSTKTATATGSETFVVVGGKPTAERIAAVRPGGMLSVFSFYETADLKPTLAKFSEEGSWRVKRVMDHLFHHVELIRKTAVTVNASQAGDLFLDRPVRLRGDSGMKYNELDNLRRVTVPLTLEEVKAGELSEASHARAVETVLQHGMCVIPSLFKAKEVSHWGKKARLDFESICSAVKSNYDGFDLIHGEDAGDKLPSNFLEISTREAKRFDIRGGPRIGEANAAADSDDKHTTLSRKHPSIVRIVKDLFNPYGEHWKGNWGKYNFEGGGVGSAPEPAISNIGAVVSVPGSNVQKIHADTPHLFEDTHLCPHYVNCFLPVVADPNDLSVGQTGFILGTHRLQVAESIVNEIENTAADPSTPSDSDILESRLCRPHVQTGDCILFDTRVWHFGMANKSNSTRRAVLYINYTQHWFARQRTDKNWGKQSVFKK